MTSIILSKIASLEPYMGSFMSIICLVLFVVYICILHVNASFVLQLAIIVFMYLFSLQFLFHSHLIIF